MALIGAGSVNLISKQKPLRRIAVTTTVTSQQPDQEAPNAFVGRVVQDLAAGESGVAAYVGDVLGLYQSMWGAGPLTPAQLATSTGTNERLVREWLHNQAAGGYVNFDSATGTFELTPEQAAVLADEESPTFLMGVLEVTAAMWAGAERLVHAFKNGGGIHYREHDPRLARGVGRIFGPLYRSSLTSQWIPAVPGLHEKLTRGTRVLDVGCGTGIATILMAQAYPNSEFVGYDLHEEALAIARQSALDAGVASWVAFELADASTVPQGEFGVACFFDALHDIGNPTAVVRAVVSRLTPGGTVLVVEPFAGDRLEDNLTPANRLYLAGSLAICTPSALAVSSDALGAQAGPARLIEVLEAGGLAAVEVVDATPLNLVIQGRR